MDITQLRYFEKLAQLQHYGKASQELFITQPTLSKSMSNLEHELGVRLFERVGRNIQLTDHGQDFSQYISVALNGFDKAIEFLHDGGPLYRGRIRIGSVISAQSPLLPKIVRALRKGFGETVEIDMYQDTTYGCIDGLKTGRFDVALCGEMAEEKNLVYTPLMFQRLVAGVDKSHPLAGKRMVTIEDLKQHRLISYRKEVFVSQVLRAVVDRYDLDLKPGFDDEYGAGWLVVAEKKSVALMLEILDGTIIQGLIGIPIKELAEPLHAINLVYNRDIYHDFMVDEMIDYLVDSSIARAS